MNNDSVLGLLKRFYDHQHEVLMEDDIPVIQSMSGSDIDNFLYMVMWVRGFDIKNGVDAIMKLESKYGAFSDFGMKEREVV